MYVITEFTPIEDDIKYIIKTFHEPVYDFVDKLNEIWHDFFYKTMEYLDLKYIKNKFFLFTSAMLDHIEEEEEKEFPLLIESYNNNVLPKNDSIIKKIVEEHNNFEKEFYVMDDELKSIGIKEWEKHYDEYSNLIKLFEEYTNESLKHIQAEIALLEKFFKKFKK